MNRRIWNGRACALICLGVFLSIAEPSYAAPVADAGPDANAVTGQPVTLDGSGSSDPNGGTITFSWRFLSVPPTSDADIVNPASDTPMFTPDLDGAYELELTVTDPGELSATDTVVITATTPNVPPVANNDSAATAVNTAVVINVVANDTDADGNLDPNSVIAANPASGEVVNHFDGTVTYTPAAGFSGTDSFTYTVNDTQGATSNSATVTVGVTAPPVANDDTGETPFNTPVDVNLVANDTDADGTLDLASVAIVGNPTNGTAVPNGSGAVTYTPTTNFSGMDSFSYTVNDNQGATSNSATVTITVQPPPPPPAADLVLSLTDIPDPLTVNGQLTYTITVRNNGPGTATGVQVEDSLPPGTLLSRLDSSQGGCSGVVKVVCDLETLAAVAEATVTINVIPTVIGDLSNTATVAAFEPDPNPANNSSTGTTMVEPGDPASADLAVTAVAELNPGTSGQGFTYRLTVTNNGSATATGVQLTNDLPRGIALGPVTASQVTYNCSDTDPMVCDLGVLSSGAAAPPVEIDVIRAEVETLPNQATVNGDQHDPNTANNFALTSALDLPTPQTACNSKRCSLRVRCNLSDLLGRTCDNQITLFVDTRARRQSNQRAARAPGPVRFAAAIRNFPGGQTTNVPLKLTPKGRKAASMLVRQGRKRLRGEMRITNAAGGIDIIRLTVRLR